MRGYGVRGYGLGVYWSCVRRGLQPDGLRQRSSFHKARNPSSGVDHEPSWSHSRVGSSGSRGYIWLYEASRKECTIPIREQWMPTLTSSDAVISRVRQLFRVS
jgi:hypothetical protein